MNPVNYDKLINQSQGNAIISALQGIQTALSGNYPLQDRDVYISDFNSVEIAPESGYYGLNYVNINLSPLVANIPTLLPTQNKAVILGNSAQTIEPDSGYYGLNQVSIPAAPVDVLEVNTNGVYNANDDGLYGYSEVNVQVPQPVFMEKTITESGVYNALDDDVDGYNVVNVQVAGGAIEVFSNGTSFMQQFNAPITINQIGTNRSILGMFAGLNMFNCPVYIPDNIWYANFAFNSCYNFNCPVTGGNNLTSCNNMFAQCVQFNQSFDVGSAVQDVTMMFYNCWRLTEPIIIKQGRSTVNAGWMFFNCQNYNRYTNFANMLNLNGCVNMFGNCRNYNCITPLPQTSHSYMYNCENMFINCIRYNQPIVIPNRVGSCGNMFRLANNMRSDIIFSGERTATFTIANMIPAQTDKDSINIYCSNLSLINRADRYSVVGQVVTWEAVTNGYYNATYNVYLLSNVEDALERYNAYYNDFMNNLSQKDW